MNYKATALILNGPAFKKGKLCFGDFLIFINQTKWKIVSSHHLIAQNTEKTSKCSQFSRHCWKNAQWFLGACSGGFVRNKRGRAGGKQGTLHPWQEQGWVFGVLGLFLQLPQLSVVSPQVPWPWWQWRLWLGWCWCPSRAACSWIPPSSTSCWCAWLPQPSTRPRKDPSLWLGLGGGWLSSCLLPGKLK